MNRNNATRIPIAVRPRAATSGQAVELEPRAQPPAGEHDELAGGLIHGDAESQEDLDALRQEADDYRDKYLRAMAEMENYKKRTDKRYAEATEAERKRLLRLFLSVADNLERVLTHADADGAVAEGVRLTYQDLQRLLRQEGIEPLTAVGQPFDPHIHEAVAVVPGDDDQSMVVDETPKGYLYHGELLRPAKVIVSQAD
ncbi:MAG: nucleotide exchange factor GrpE [Chloroflexota bacterium]|nr:nucleotide exchange factor GrpE [Chloroflexota bacterium]